MNKQEAKILAAELEGNRYWHVPRIHHGLDAIDGWYVIIELRQHANYRVILTDHRYATPQRMATYRDTLVERCQQGQSTGMLLVPLSGESVMMP